MLLHGLNAFRATDAQHLSLILHARLNSLHYLFSVLNSIKDTHIYLHTYHANTHIHNLSSSYVPSFAIRLKCQKKISAQVKIEALGDKNSKYYMMIYYFPYSKVKIVQ